MLQLRGWQKGWEWAQRVGANTGLFVARSRDVPTFFDRPIKTIYDDDLAQRRYGDVNDVYRKLITERHPQLSKLHCP